MPENKPYTLKDTIHIFYIPVSKRQKAIDNIIYQLNIIKSEVKELYIILQDELLEKLASTFKEDDLIYFWVHADIHYPGNGIPYNLIFSSKLKSKKRIASAINIPFITTGSTSNSSLLGEPIENNPYGKKIRKDGEVFFVYSMDVLDDINLLPDAHGAHDLFGKLKGNNTEIINKQFNKAPNVFFPKTKYDFKVKTLLTALGAETINYVIGETIGEAYEQYYIDVLNPGYSGAYVLKVRATKGNQENHFVLKLSKDREELVRELEAGTKNRLNNLGEKFIVAHPEYCKEDVLDWACNVYPLGSGDTLRKNLKKQFIEEHIIDTTFFAKTLETFKKI